jgi:hypothetical protein
VEYSYSANKTVLDGAIINGIGDSKKNLLFYRSEHKSIWLKIFRLF